MSQVTITLSAILNSNFTQTFSKAKGYIKQFKDSINSSLFATMGAAQMAGKAIGFVTGSLQQVMAEAKQFEKTGIKFGVDPSEVAKLGKMAEETMTPVRSLYKGLNQLKAGASQALQDPKGDMGKAFEQLGISVTDLRNGLVDPIQLLGKVSDAFNEIGDDAQRQQAIMEIFKANGFALAGVLEMTAEEQKKLLSGHTTMSTAVIGQNAAMEDTWGRFMDVLKNAIAMFGLVLNPLLQVLAILLNVISMLTKAIGGTLFAALEVIGGAIISIVGVVGLLIGGILKLNGMFSKFLGLGDGFEKFADGWLEMSANITKGGIAGGLAGAKKTMEATQRGIMEDVDDVKRSGSNITAGYGSSKKAKKDGSRDFKSTEQLKAEKEALEDAKKKREEAEKEAKIQAAKDQGKYDEINHQKALLKLRREMQEAGADEYDIEKALLEMEVRRQYAILGSTSGTDAAQAILEKDKLLAKIHENEKKRIEERKKAEIKARLETYKAGLTFMETIEEVGGKLKEEGMRRAGKTEGEIKSSQFADELDKAERMRAEYQAELAKNGGKENENTFTMRNELAQQEGKVIGLARDNQQGSLGVMADSMRRIGGGGTAVSTGSNSALDISRKQLDKVTKMEEGIQKLVEIVSKTGLASTQKGRELQVERMAYGSDNAPKN